MLYNKQLYQLLKKNWPFSHVHVRAQTHTRVMHTTTFLPPQADLPSISSVLISSASHPQINPGFCGPETYVIILVHL